MLDSIVGILRGCIFYLIMIYSMIFFAAIMPYTFIGVEKNVCQQGEMSRLRYALGGIAACWLKEPIVWKG